MSVLTTGEIFLSALGAAIIGFVCGFCFSYAAGDSKHSKSIAVGMGAGMFGWTIAMFLPIHEYKLVASLGFALLASINGSHIYWAVFKDASKILKEIDGDPIRNAHRTL